MNASPKSIAVLPFVNRSEDADLEYFSDGMTEEVINALTSIEGLQVTSRTSSFFFKNKSLPIAHIGEQLQVATVLEGSIRVAAPKMRITVRLIDVASDTPFWSESFDRALDDIFAVQDELSLLIADRLREHLGHLDIADQLVVAPEVPVAIYTQYLKSRYHILRMNRADLDLALSILQQILATHPQFALAHLGIHQAYTMLGTIGMMSSVEAFMKGQPYLREAIALDPSLPECQLNLSWKSLLEDWDLAKAYHHLHQAAARRPVVDYYQSMASTLIAEGKHQAAMQYIETAQQMDPFLVINYHLKGFIYYVKRDYRAAIDSFKEATALQPEFMPAKLYRGQALIKLGKKEEAMALFINFPADSADDIPKLAGMTMAYAALGRQEEAQDGIAQLEAFAKTALAGRAILALLHSHTLLGNIEKAIGYLKQGIQMRLPLMIYLPVEPLMDPLRERPEVQALLLQILGTPPNTHLPKRKYKKALFSKEEIQRHKTQLEQLMNEQGPYFDPELTLRSLAQMLDLPANHLSQLLNEGFQQNFSAFVNTYRLEAFKAKAADPKFRHLTILALAYESGFNSKTVFNTFFKKKMGQTPKAYWKSLS
ncbi:MAG: helix-turn-helix domain-containing protein [Bacteroidota bacterium]